MPQSYRLGTRRHNRRSSHRQALHNSSLRPRACRIQRNCHHDIARPFSVAPPDTRSILRHSPHDEPRVSPSVRTSVRRLRNSAAGGAPWGSRSQRRDDHWSASAPAYLDASAVVLSTSGYTNHHRYILQVKNRPPGKIPDGKRRDAPAAVLADVSTVAWLVPACPSVHVAPSGRLGGWAAGQATQHALPDSPGSSRD